MNKISNINYCGKKVTDNNNVYNGSNIGKYTGLGIGIAMTAREIYGINKTFNKDKNFREFYDKLVKNIIDMIETLADKNLSIDADKYKKIGKYTTSVLFSLAYISLGLVLGAIADKIINKFRANKTDEIVQIQQNYLIEEYLKATGQEQDIETKNLS